MGASFKTSPHDISYKKWFLDLRYVRVGEAETPQGPKVLSQVVIFQMGNRSWDATTAFVPSRGDKPVASGVNAKRAGKRLWWRKR